MKGGITSCRVVIAVFQASDRGRLMVFCMVHSPPRKVITINGASCWTRRRTPAHPPAVQDDERGRAPYRERGGQRAVGDGSSAVPSPAEDDEPTAPAAETMPVSGSASNEGSQQ